MKKTLLIAGMAAFLAAPLAACDMDHMNQKTEAKSDKDQAAVKTEKTSAKAGKWAKAGKHAKDSKTVALANDQKAKN